MDGHQEKKCFRAELRVKTNGHKENCLPLSWGARVRTDRVNTYVCSPLMEISASTTVDLVCPMIGGLKTLELYVERPKPKEREGKKGNNLAGTFQRLCVYFRFLFSLFFPFYCAAFEWLCTSLGKYWTCSIVDVSWKEMRRPFPDFGVYLSLAIAFWSCNMYGFRYVFSPFSF